MGNGVAGIAVRVPLRPRVRLGQHDREPAHRHQRRRTATATSSRSAATASSRTAPVSASTSRRSARSIRTTRVTSTPGRTSSSTSRSSPRPTTTRHRHRLRELHRRGVRRRPGARARTDRARRSSAPASRPATAASASRSAPAAAACRITATATDAAGNTSEFAANVLDGRSAASAAASAAAAARRRPPPGTTDRESDDVRPDGRRRLRNGRLGGLWALAGPDADFDVDGSVGHDRSCRRSVSRGAYRDAPGRERTGRRHARQGLARPPATSNSAYVSLLARRGGARLPRPPALRARGHDVPPGRARGGRHRDLHGIRTERPCALRVRARASGCACRCRARARPRSACAPWVDGSPEPSTWAYTATDSTAGVRARDGRVPGGGSRRRRRALPTVFSFDGYRVTTLADDAPGAERATPLAPLLRARARGRP